MAQPQQYEREVDFTERDGDDTNHAAINSELDAAALSINQIRDNLALIQRDDGALKNGIVTAESLAPSAFDAVLVEVNVAVGEAQTAATSANNAALSANTARDQAVAAKDTAVTSANAAALNATTATTKAAESAASATAAATSATNSATSATSSANSATTATTKAGEAVTSATNAAASATAAAASQTAAATSATNSASSATTATTQAGIATTQATSAAESATAAAASLEDFDDRYLCSKTADPTTDNDGNPLITGALYFNSVAGEMRVWAGTFWKATGSSVGGTINTAKYTATAGQTTFAIVYDVGFVHVYLNGVKLESGVEFTANNGTSVVLATGAIAGDVVDMIAFGIFSVANTYTKAEADSLLAAKAPQATTYTKTEVDTADALKLNAANPSYTGTLTGGTGVVNLGSGQLYKDASGNLGIGTVPGVKLDVKPADLGTTAGNTSYAYRATISAAGNTDQFDVLWYRTASAGGWTNADLILQRNVDGSAAQSKIVFGGSNYTGFWTNGAERARIDSSGNLLVGRTTNASTASRAVFDGGGSFNAISCIRPGTGFQTQIEFFNGNGGVGFISTNGTGTSYVTSSDYRLKEDVQPMTGALSLVQQLKPCTYKWKSDGSDGQGFIAHELQAVVPDAVTGEKDAVDAEGNPQYQGIDVSFLVATLTAAIQEQQAMIEQLKADVAALKAAA